MTRFIAIDPDAPGLLVLSGAIKNGTVSLERCAIGPDDVPKFSPATGGTLGTALKTLLKTSGIKPAPVLIALGRDRLILKEVKYPPCEPEDEPLLVRNQVVRELTDTSDDVVMDYIPLDPAADGQRRAQVVFIRKDLLLGLQALCNASGLKLAGVTPRPYAAIAGLKAAILAGSTQPPQSATLAIASISERGGEFTLAQNGELLLTRILLPYTTDRALASEIKRNLTIYAGMPNANPVDILYIPEGGRRDTTIAERIQDLLPLLVESFDLLKNSELGEQVPASYHGALTQLAGLLHLRAQSETLPINFIEPRQPRSEPGKGRLLGLLGALAATVVLGGLGLLGFLMVQSAEQRLISLRSEAEQLDAQLKRMEIDEKRLEALDEFASREVVWLDELYDLTDRIPDVKRLTISTIDARELPLPKAPKKANTSATGGPSITSATSVSPSLKSAIKGPTAKPASLPIATLRLEVRTNKAEDVQELVDALNKDKFYQKSMKSKQLNATGAEEVYIVTTEILRRTPADYLRKLAVKPPTVPVEEPEVIDDNPFGGF